MYSFCLIYLKVDVPFFSVERRRRDKINNWIVQLSKTIPDCNIDATKNGQVSLQVSGSSIIFNTSTRYTSVVI